MAFDLTRRHFFYGTLLAGAVPAGGFGSTPSLKALGYKSPNEKLNIASIGAGGKAASDIGGCAPTENIVALCDVDDKQAAQTFKQFEKAAEVQRFPQDAGQGRQEHRRRDRHHSGPHARHRRHVVHGARQARLRAEAAGAHRSGKRARCVEAANKYKVATQMGNQGYSNEGTRQCAEMIWAGEIGNVTEVHAWTDRPIWPQGLTEIPPPEPVPATLDWDLWLGIAEKRPYTAGGEGYPNQLRRLLLPALQLARLLRFRLRRAGRHGVPHPGRAQHGAAAAARPTSVECIKKEGTSDFMFPKTSVIRFDFPARGNMPPVKMFWYDGLKETAEDRRRSGRRDASAICPIVRGGRGQGAAAAAPAAAGVRGVRNRLRRAASSTRRVRRTEAADADAPRFPRPTAACSSATRACITTGTYGEQTRLLPVEKMKDYKFPPPLLTRSPGPLPRLDPRLQGRRPGLLELQRGGAVRRVDAARRDRAARRRQARIRSGEDADHQQRRSQQVPEARVSARAGRSPVSFSERDKLHGLSLLFPRRKRRRRQDRRRYHSRYAAVAGCRRRRCFPQARPPRNPLRTP